MQLITSVIDLEHDICVEWREVEKYLKYDSISGNLHQFFSSSFLSRVVLRGNISWHG